MIISSNVRRNGKPITYKTRPDDWRAPIKHGLKGYGYISADNAHEFHVAAECPLAEPAMVRERELAEHKKHVGTILLRLARPLKPPQRRKLFALSPEDKLTIATHAFPEAIAQILIEKEVRK